MKIEKPGAEILALFERLVPEAPGVERRTMFGARAAWVNGNMFMGTFEQDLVLRLPPELRDELIARGGEPFTPMGRPMREYVVVPRDLHDADTELGAWVDRAQRFAAAMPVKVTTPKASRSRSSGDRVNGQP